MNPPEHLKACSVCANAGFTRPDVKKVKHVKEKLFKKGVAWSCDLCGPFKPDRNGIRYVMGFTELRTGYSKVYGLKRKTQNTIY